jgi:hypothetical protein
MLFVIDGNRTEFFGQGKAMSPAYDKTSRSPGSQTYLKTEKTHGSRPENADVVPCRNPASFHGMKGRGRSVDVGGFVEGHLTYIVNGTLGCDNELRIPPRYCKPIVPVPGLQSSVVLTDVVPTDHAVPANPAPLVGFRGDAVADLEAGRIFADLSHRAGPFMAWDKGIALGPETLELHALHNGGIRSAYGDGRHLHEGFLRAWARHVDFTDLKCTWPCENQGFHLFGYITHLFPPLKAW